MTDAKDYGELWTLRYENCIATIDTHNEDGNSDNWGTTEPYERAIECVNSCRGFDPQEMRMKAIAWDLRCDSRLGFMAVGSDGYGFSNDRWETPTQWYKSEHEAICHAAVAAKVELNGKILTEEDLK